MISTEQKEQLMQLSMACRLQKVARATVSDYGIFKSEYMDDEEAPVCQLCGKAFSLFTRRHHCRNCYIVYCADCCVGSGEKRLCTVCGINVRLMDGSRTHHLAHVLRRSPALLALLDGLIGDEGLSGVTRFGFTQATEALRVFATAITAPADVDALFDDYKQYFELALKMGQRFVIDYPADQLTTNADGIESTKERIAHKRAAWHQISLDQQASLADVLATLLTNVLAFCDQNKYDGYLVQQDAFKALVGYYANNYIDRFQEDQQEYLAFLLANLLSYHNFDFLDKEALEKCIVHAIIRFPDVLTQVLLVLNFDGVSDNTVDALESKVRNLIALDELTGQQKVAVALYARKKGRHEKVGIARMAADGDSGYDMACRLLLGRECPAGATEYFDYLRYEQGGAE